MRKRLPAGGRNLRAARERYNAPAIERVWVIVGADWGRLPPDDFVLCVNPEAAPDSYDFTILAGLPVDVVSRDGAEIEPFAGEIAHCTAPVRLHWLLGEPDWPIPIGPHREDVADVAFCQRKLSKAGATWPSWWSDTRDKEYGARKRAYLASQAADAIGV